MSRVVRGLETLLNAETARADAAERLAERYLELLTQVVTVRFGRQYKALEAEIRHALASAPGYVSRKGDNLDAKADGSEGER